MDDGHTCCAIPQGPSQRHPLTMAAGAGTIRCSRRLLAEKRVNIFSRPSDIIRRDEVPVLARATFANVNDVRHVVALVGGGIAGTPWRVSFGSRRHPGAKTYPNSTGDARHGPRLMRSASGGRHQVAVFHSRQLGEEKEPLRRQGSGHRSQSHQVALVGKFRDGE